MELGAKILCGPDGLVVTLPGATTVNCGTAYSGHTQLLLTETDMQMAEIFWGHLTTDTGILAEYLKWKPWILSLDVYSPLVDPYHVTLFYDTEHTEWHEDLFDDHLQDKLWEVHPKRIYVGPQGLAALVELTPEQMVWHKMQDEPVSHVSLALHVGH